MNAIVNKIIKNSRLYKYYNQKPQNIIDSRSKK